MPQSYKVFVREKPVLITAHKSLKANINKDFNVLINPSEKELRGLIRDLEKKVYSGAILISDKPSKLFKRFRSLFIKAKACGGLVVNPQKEYLFIFRNGKWDLPKGKMDPGERKKETAVREVEEECAIDGIDIGRRITTTYHTYKRSGVHYFKPSFWYFMKIDKQQKGKPQKSEGITRIKWVKKKDIPKLLGNSYPTIRVVVNAAFNDLDS